MIGRLMKIVRKAAFLLLFSLKIKDNDYFCIVEVTIQSNEHNKPLIKGHKNKRK